MNLFTVHVTPSGEVRPTRGDPAVGPASLAGAGGVQAHDRQVNALERGLLVGEMSSGVDRSADPPMAWSMLVDQREPVTDVGDLGGLDRAADGARDASDPAALARVGEETPRAARVSMRDEAVGWAC
ncbi:MAG: hypothetical protein JO100_10105 [Pseudonocardia sp.]|nr:hypothetical protein [Pseudonocardia sp.]